MKDSVFAVSRCADLAYISAGVGPVILTTGGSSIYSSCRATGRDVIGTPGVLSPGNPPANPRCIQSRISGFGTQLVAFSLVKVPWHIT